MKKGISLIYLVIVILVITILSSIVIFSANTSLTDTKTKTFAEEMSNILSGVQEYYLMHGVYPITSDTYTKNTLLSIPETVFARSLLEQDLTYNGDDDGLFYKIDRDLLQITGGIYGTESNTNDFYVINENATQIYYPLGASIGDTYYFSLNDKIIDIQKMNINEIYSEKPQIQDSTSAIKVTKITEAYTSSLNLTYYSLINTGEVLKYTLGGATYELLSSSGNIQITSASLSSSQKSALSTDPYIIFRKFNSSNEIIATTKIDISNLDYTPPTIGNVSVVSYSGYNLVKFPLAIDTQTGVASSFYTTDSSLTSEQIVASGTRGDIDSIKLNKNISYIKFVLVDNSGNISNIVEVNI